MLCDFIFKTDLVSYYMKIQNTINFSGYLPLSMPVVQGPLRLAAFLHAKFFDADFFNNFEKLNL